MHVLSLNLDPSSPKHSIAAILSGLNEPALERVAVDVIREQRRFLEKAQTLYKKLSPLEAEAPLDDEMEEIRHEYRLALLMMRAHQASRHESDESVRLLRTYPELTSV